MIRRTSVKIALAACFTLASVPALADGPAASQPTLEQKYDALQTKVDALQQQLDNRNMVAIPTTEPAPGGPAAGGTFFDPAVFKMPDDFTAGYDKGFFLKKGDEDLVKVNGLIDLRYNFAQSTNKSGITDTALGTDHVQDASGFNLFDAQLTVSGYLFNHGHSNVFYKMMGNFGTVYQPATAQSGSFLINELYGGYQFDEHLRLRGGSVVVPLTPLRTITDYGGLTFPDVSDVTVPFLPGLGLGADVLGSLAQNTITYDFLVCNGSNSNVDTNSTQPLVGRDNRLGVYTREQWAIAGKLGEDGDFNDESDISYHPNLVACVGGGFGYESQNTGGNAYPGPQTTLGITGISSATGVGFRPRYNVDGDIFRYVADVRLKYRGFSFFGEGLYQHIAAETPTFIPGWPEHSIGQTAFFAQAGYFVIPHHLEIAGRFGQLYTNGLRHEMDQYSFGVNYYIYGQNLKLQLAETYIPRQAALTSNNGSIANTQDWITQVQLQLKF